MECNFDLQNIIARISKLNKKEKLHILNILKIHQKDYTKNAYGYFFNLGTLENDVLYKVSKCLELIETNRDLIWEMDKRRDDMLVHYKTLIEERLKSTIAENRQKYVNMLMLHPSSSEMKISIRRVMKIKKRVYHDESVDPDVLLKEHNKARKYPKNSVYYRLLTCCKPKRYNRGKDDQEQSDSEDRGKEHVDASSEYDNVDDDDGANSELHSDDIEVQSVKNEYSNSDDESTSDKEEYQSDIDNTSVKEESIDEYTVMSKRTSRQEEKMSFYRRLLNMKGFEFDKTSILKREDYIT